MRAHKLRLVVTQSPHSCSRTPLEGGHSQALCQDSLSCTFRSNGNKPFLWNIVHLKSTKPNILSTSFHSHTWLVPWAAWPKGQEALQTLHIYKVSFYYFRNSVFLLGKLYKSCLGEWFSGVCMCVCGGGGVYANLYTSLHQILTNLNNSKQKTIYLVL